jgi:hypothetical protein
MTLGTAAAIREFQFLHFGDADNVVDPGKRTLQRLNEVATGTNVPTRAEKAIELAPTARMYALATQPILSQARTVINSNTLNSSLSMVNIHFHLDRAPANRRTMMLDRLVLMFGKIAQVLAKAEDHFVTGTVPNTTAYADAHTGGIGYPITSVYSKIRFFPAFDNLSDYSRIGVILHECAHFCGFTDDVLHFALAHPFPFGAPTAPCPRNYQQLLPDEALRKAESYKAMAIHAGTGSDTR